MEKPLITGNGPLHGEIVIAGAKNAALPVIAASRLTSAPLQFSNAPTVKDIATALELMKFPGCKVDRQDTGPGIDTRQEHAVKAPCEFVKTMRGSILLRGPLLARSGEADISLPGGCAGSRPVNEHISGQQRMGPKITIEGGYIKARAWRLQGAPVMATDLRESAALAADGETCMDRVDHLDRGYANVEQKLAGLGAIIRRV